MRRMLAVLLVLAACSSEQPSTTETTASQATDQKAAAPAVPTPDQAREKIAASSEFGQHEFTNAGVSMPVSGAAMNEPTRQIARQLAAGGWVEIDPSGDVMLTARSRQDKRFILRENGLLDVVPLAKKEIGEVTAVRQIPDGTIAVDFTWRWIANEVGKSFTSGPIHDRFAAQQNASASLIWNGTEWTMLSVAPR
jgi:hypothetical protein